MSPELQKFFLEIHEWIEQGCPEHEVFLKNSGLCATLEAYAGFLNLEYRPLNSELDNLLRPIDGSSVPFNPSLQAYRSELYSKSIYQNPARLAFIKQQVELIKNA